MDLGWKNFFVSIRQLIGFIWVINLSKFGLANALFPCSSQNEIGIFGDMNSGNGKVGLRPSPHAPNRSQVLVQSLLNLNLLQPDELYWLHLMAP